MARTVVHPSRSIYLDAVRAIAALEVFAGHMRQYFLVDYASLIHKGAATRLFYISTALGHAAVMVFFVLSGFFISSSVIDRMRSGRWSWSGYIVQRWTRLYAVLLPALILGALWDTASLRYLPAEVASITNQIRAHFGFGTWVGNLFFLQKIAVPVFGSNGPLWSLSYEFWYYLAFPCFVTAVLGKGWRRLVFALVGAAILVMVGVEIAEYFSVWLLGVGVALLPAPSRRQTVALVSVGGAAFLLLLLRAAHDGGVDSFAHDLQLGIAFAAVCWGIARLPAPASGWHTRIVSMLAARSYTLYLLHYPVVVFLSGVLMGASRWRLGLGSLAATLLVAAAVMGYVEVVWTFTEARTDRIRRAVSAALVRRGVLRDAKSDRDGAAPTAK